MNDIIMPAVPARPGPASRYGGTQAAAGTRALLAGAAQLAVGEGPTRTAEVSVHTGGPS